MWEAAKRLGRPSTRLEQDVMETERPQEGVSSEGDLPVGRPGKGRGTRSRAGPGEAARSPGEASEGGCVSRTP